ncbi:MAG: hypothetical protein IKC31_07260 [Clostridia bacterium]|nr:hypothetical protein [Clostridia bacterium]
MRNNLILLAEQEAKLNYRGDSGEGLGNLQPLFEPFEGTDLSFDALNADWSGAFVYACVKKAGYPLPARYPDPRVGLTFASTLAWMRYARLPKIRRWHTDLTEIEEGDIVILSPTEQGIGQMGIVLSVGAFEMELAMGNYHNHSAIVSHSLTEGVLGFIRL